MWNRECLLTSILRISKKSNCDESLSIETYVRVELWYYLPLSYYSCHFHYLSFVLFFSYFNKSYLSDSYLPLDSYSLPCFCIQANELFIPFNWLYHIGFNRYILILDKPGCNTILLRRSFNLLFSWSEQLKPVCVCSLKHLQPDFPGECFPTTSGCAIP